MGGIADRVILVVQGSDRGILYIHRRCGNRSNSTIGVCFGRLLIMEFEQHSSVREIYSTLMKKERGIESQSTRRTTRRKGASQTYILDLRFTTLVSGTAIR